MVKKRALLSACALIFIGLASYAQVETYRGVKGFATKQATVNMEQLGKKYPEVKEGVPKLKIPNSQWEEEPVFGKINPSEILFKASSKQMKSTESSRTVSPAPDTTFQALYDNGVSIPPDVNGVAGLNHLMVTLNTQVRIQDRQGHNLMTTSLSNFWHSMPNSGGTFDPKILYDPYANRWIMVTPSGSNSTDTRLYVGVSTTSNPLGDWNMFWIDPDPQNQTWFDYPSMGFNKKWIVISGNMFGSGFYRTVFVIDKVAAYNGETNVPYTRFATSAAFTLVPSITYDSTAENIYLIASDNGSSGGYGYIKKFKVSGVVDSPQFTYQGAIGIPEPWDGGQGDFLPQLGSPQKINSVDSRMEDVIYRNGKLWAVHHVFLPANNPQRCAIQWWELDTAGVVLNYGRIQDSSNLFSFAFPTIAVNANEDVMIGHDVFSSTQYAGAGYSYKSHYDDNFRSYYQYKDGLAPYYKTYGGTRNRWGDYSATCVDPVNDYNFWTIQEYAEAPSGQDKWGTWWAFMRPMFSPLSDFTADNLLVPAGDTVHFTDLTQGVPTQWNWTFNGANPDSSNQQNPVDVVYPQAGSWDVQLVSSNTYGMDTILKSGYITASTTILPEIHFSADTDFICTGEAVSFHDSTLYMPHFWTWQFDPSTVRFVNGTSENSENPQVVFDDPGVYSVTLSATNLNGTSTLTQFEMIQAGGYVPYFHETFEEPLSEHHWTIENPDHDKTWEPFQVGGNGPGNSAMAVNFREVYGIGRKDRLISPAFNLNGMSAAYLTFQHAFAQRNPGVSDSLFVLVSGDCGITWTRVFAGGEDGTGNFATHQITDYDFVPEVASDWCGFGWGSGCNTIDLTPWAGQDNVKIAFETFSMYGNPIFIDNVIIDQFTGVANREAKETDVSIFPNPAHKGFTVSWPTTSSFSALILENQMGKKMLSKHFTEKVRSVFIQTGTIPAGIYIVFLQGNRQTITKKVVVY